MTETRAEKAQRLVNEGRVEIIRRNSMFTQAHIAGDNRDYVTFLFSSGNHFCLCAWGLYHSYTDDLCTYALAIKLAVEKEE